MGIGCSKTCPICNKDYCCLLTCKRCNIQNNFINDAFSIDEFRYQDLPDTNTNEKKINRQLSV